MSVILITGASSGFGKLTALAFARQGDTVYATMRDPKKGYRLQDAASAENLHINPLALDVTDTASIHAAVKNVLAAEERIDVLVNNAGIHIPGALEDMPESDLHRVMDTNFFGVINMTRAVLPTMRKQKSGRIIMMSSVGGMISRATDSIYCASKWALEGMSEALRYEVARFGIKVSMIEPGVFRTEIGSKYKVSLDYPQASPYRELLKFRADKVVEDCNNGDDPQLVADLVVAVTNKDNPDVRYPAGQQAEKFLPELKRMDADERDDLIRTAAGIDWWLEGRNL